MKSVIKHFLPLLISLTLLSQQYWFSIPSPTTKKLIRCHFIDTLYGWACGDSGIVIHTSNSGFSWVTQNTGITDPIDDIFFTSRFNGWAVANDFLFYGTKILRTTNGGNIWTYSRFPDTTVVFNAVHFIDSLTGFLTGFTGRIFKTTNGGINWTESYVDSLYCPFIYLFPKWRINFLTSQTGYIAGGQIDIQGIVWQTTNGGNHWFTYCVTPEPLYAVKPINASKVIAGGGDFEYGTITAQTYTAGFPWFYDTTTCFGVGRDLAFRTPSELWIPCSYSMKWAVNLDSGSLESDWLCIDTPDSISVYAAQFVTATFGFGFGDFGKIVKYNSAVIPVSENNSHIPKFSLRQNYPNPFNPYTYITYQLPEKTTVKIRIYDLSGREIRYIFENEKNSGEHKLLFDGSGLASGVYFYTVEAGKYRDSKKMVILK